jgi:hypothetical protein
MNTHADKTEQNKSDNISTSQTQNPSVGKAALQFSDNRPAAVAQANLQQMANNSSAAVAQTNLQQMANNSPRTAQLRAVSQMAKNNTGMPDNLKSGIESLSGVGMDDVKVHYNSAKPAQLNAHAYAQGSDIHLGSGQEKHLPHEAWHVVQQKQGRVNATKQLKAKVYINDDEGLEKEADVMGAKALQMQPIKTPLQSTMFKPKLSPIATQLRSIYQLEDDPTTPTVTSGVELDVLGNLSGISTAYAIGVIKQQLISNATLKAVLLQVLGFALSSLGALSNWILLIKQAYLQLKGIADIPRGVVAVFLWGIGKLFLWFANKLYNGGKVAYLAGDITETTIFNALGAVDDTHQGIQAFIHYIERINGYILWYLGSGTAEDQASAETADDSSAAIEDSSSQFLTYKVETPTLAEFDMDDKARAGLAANASVHVNLLGQSMGGDIGVKLPFGSDWQVGIDKFFKSSSISLGGLSVGNISGDSLLFSNKGLESVAMSVNELDVANGIVTAEKISVHYRRADDSIEFTGKGSAKLWDDKRLNGDIRLSLGTDGSFKKAHIMLETGSTFSAIPNYLDVIAPHGKVDIFNSKAPNVLIGAGILVKGLPGGIRVESEGGISYQDSELTGFLRTLDVTIPLTDGAKLNIGLTNGQFNKKSLSSDNAYIVFDYDKARAKKDDSTETADSVFGSGLDLSWLAIPGLDVQALILREELTNISLQDGKFGYERGDATGLRKLNARVLGVSAEYNAQDDGSGGSGSLDGKVGHEIKATVARVDFPLIPGAGGSLELSGGFGFNGTLRGALAKNAKRSTDRSTAISVSGDVGAGAYAKLKLSVGAFVGVPYLATMTGGVYGEIVGDVTGNVGLSGGLIYDSESSSIKKDPVQPVKGTFALKGGLMAHVGLELKTNVLVFEKQLAKAKLGDWALGEYGITGELGSDSTGNVTFNISTNGFTSGKPNPAKIAEEVIGVDVWIKEGKAQGSSVSYETDADRNIGKVARNILYGGFGTSEIVNLKADYLSLLAKRSDKVTFNTKYSALEADFGSVAKGSFIWSGSVWSDAVDMRTILGIDQSRSKRKIYNHLLAYHSEVATQYTDRLSILTQLEEVINHYVNDRSKIPDNKKEALQLASQVKLEKMAVMMMASRE